MIPQVNSALIQLKIKKKKSNILYLADCGDYVIVLNAKEILVSGKKAEQKLYRHHTMHPGGLKEITFNNLQAKDATEPLRKAVSGMLPKNRLREVRMDRLKIFEGAEHPYEANIIKQHGVNNKD
jgi:large subunit ribosomal protein L13